MSMPDISVNKTLQFIRLTNTSIKTISTLENLDLGLNLLLSVQNNIYEKRDTFQWKFLSNSGEYVSVMHNKLLSCTSCALASAAELSQSTQTGHF